MEIKGVLFDCDGCLLDSEFIYLNSLVEFFDSIGIKTTLEDVVFVVGKPNPVILQDLLAKFNLYDRFTVDELNDGINKVFDNRFDNAVLTPMPHLIDLLKLIKNRDIKVAVVSSSSNSYLVDVMKRIGISEYVDLLIGREYVTKGKPNPDIYLLAKDKLNLEKENLIIIEDSVNGIKAGKAADIYTIGYKGSVVKQDTSEADRQIDDYQEIFELFN